MTDFEIKVAASKDAIGASFFFMGRSFREQPPSMGEKVRACWPVFLIKSGEGCFEHDGMQIVWASPEEALEDLENILPKDSRLYVTKFTYADIDVSSGRA